MKEVKVLAKQTLVYGLGTIIPRFLNYGILTFFYTRVLSKAEYGVITELYAWMVLILIVLTYGMETGFFRFSQQKENFEKIYSTTLISLFITSMLFLVAINIFIMPVAALLNYKNNHDYIRMISVIMAIDAFSAIPFARLRRENKALKFSIIKIFNVIVNIAVVLFLLLIAPGIHEKSTGWFSKMYNPDYKVGYILAANIAGSVATLIMLMPQVIIKKPVFDRHIWVRMINYSFPLLVTGLSGCINDMLDKVILRRVSGESSGLETVGEYGAGYKIAVLMGLFIQMFRFAAEPFFFEKAKQENAKDIYMYVMKYFVIIMLIIYLFINLYLTGFQYILGKDFRDSIAVVPIIAMAYLLYGIYVNHSIWYKLKDMTRFGIFITLAGAAVTVLVNVIFIPLYGYMASAWGHVIAYATMIILSFILSRNRYYIDYRMNKLIPYFLIAILFVLVSMNYNYGNLKIELTINTMMLICFVIYAQLKDNILVVFFRK
jgi:O-antigen/teichoic acid export membrane protein